jgi:hypothetical protein
MPMILLGVVIVLAFWLVLREVISFSAGESLGDVMLSASVGVIAVILALYQIASRPR